MPRLHGDNYGNAIIFFGRLEEEEGRAAPTTPQPSPASRGGVGGPEADRACPPPCVSQQEMLRYKEVCYYMLFALAAYGWPMYLMRKPACGLCQLARSCS